MEENDRKVREAYRKKIKGRTSLNTLTKAKTKKKKSKAKRTYRGFVQNNSTNQTKALKDSADEKMIVPQDKDTLIRK